MNTHRNNPDGDPNTSDTRDNARAVFAAKMQAPARDTEDRVIDGFDAWWKVHGDGNARNRLLAYLSYLQGRRDELRDTREVFIGGIAGTVVEEQP